MSNRDYQSMMSRDGKDKLRQEVLAEIRAVQKKQPAKTSMMSCSQASWWQ